MRCGTEKLVDFVVLVERRLHVGAGTDAGADEVIAVHRGRHGDALAPGLHELQQCHLRRGVLHGDTIGAQIDPALAALDVRGGGVVEVDEEDLLREGQGAAEAAAHEVEALVKRRVKVTDQVAHLLLALCGSGA